MKLRKHQITIVAAKISNVLLETGSIVLDDDYSRKEFIKFLDHFIYEELALEDKLNDEVREILREYTEEFESGRVEYHSLFKMVKEKIAKEKGIIL